MLYRYQITRNVSVDIHGFTQNERLDIVAECDLYMDGCRHRKRRVVRYNREGEAYVVVNGSRLYLVDGKRVAH